MAAILIALCCIVGTLCAGAICGGNRALDELERDQ